MCPKIKMGGGKMVVDRGPNGGLGKYFGNFQGGGGNKFS